MQTIRVDTPSAKYDVIAGSGLLGSLASRIERIAGKLPRRVFVLTSPEIWALWGTAFLASFAEPPVTLFLPAGEKHKTMQNVDRLLRQMIAGGRRSRLAADRIWRRDRWRCWRVCGCHLHARNPLRAGADDVSGAGGFVGGRQRRASTFQRERTWSAAFIIPVAVFRGY